MLAERAERTAPNIPLLAQMSPTSPINDRVPLWLETLRIESKMTFWPNGNVWRMRSSALCWDCGSRKMKPKMASMSVISGMNENKT